MTHTIIYNPDTHIIEIKVQDTVALTEIKEIYSEAIQVALEKESFLFLSDYREATINLSTSDIYDLPKILSDMVAPIGLNVQKLKRAVIPSKNLKDFQFFKTVTSNRGQSTGLFEDVDGAKKWLFEK